MINFVRAAISAIFFGLTVNIGKRYNENVVVMAVVQFVCSCLTQYAYIKAGINFPEPLLVVLAGVLFALANPVVQKRRIGEFDRVYLVSSITCEAIGAYWALTLIK
eukprot:TRINITY_DN9167_c0_g1_i1.p1 TRINITY_DN9167_c0_g1~~TRINITY_DN9167_c0_g1_i1.p1  ORF type:complete len:106 (-),score=14.21 TRINITY_DN9167_c0_g1_i1:77-394(-)